MRWLLASLTVVAAISVAGFVSSAAGAATSKCPSGGTPAPGSTVTGGLEVDGFCVLQNVAVTGGIHVDPTADTSVFLNWNLVDLIDSTVHGGVVVAKGSELDTSINEADFSVTSAPSTIDGGVKLDQSIFPVLANATVRGGIATDGITEPPTYVLPGFCGDAGDPQCWNNDIFCGLTIYGDVVERNLDFTQAFLGDPLDFQFANSDCQPNTIHGSVTMKDSNFVRFDGEPSEIEGDTVTGSVIVDHSTAEVSDNTIGGSLLCTNGTVIHPPASYELPGGNTVRGQDTCD